MLSSQIWLMWRTEATTKSLSDFVHLRLMMKNNTFKYKLQGTVSYVPFKNVYADRVCVSWGFEHCFHELIRKSIMVWASVKSGNVVRKVLMKAIPL